MKRPWRNPLRPLAGCAALLGSIALFFYLNSDRPLYYGSNDEDAPKDCNVPDEDYVFSIVLCEADWVDSVKVCDYYKPASEQKDCVQLSATYSACHKSGLEVLHVCEY